MKANLRKSLFLAGIIASASALAAEAPAGLSAAYSQYRKGDYPRAIATLQGLSQDPAASAQPGLIDYWIGLSHARLQAFEKARESFERATRAGFKAEDLDFELGQALYALQQYRPAREAFRRSAQARFKPGASLYYVGSIGQTLEEPAQALQSYRELLSLAGDADKVRQATYLQIAEIALAQTEQARFTDEQARNDRLRHFVFPRFQKAADYEAGTPAAAQALERMNEIQKRLSSEVLRMRNGVPIPAKAWSVRATQEAKYDTNVVTEADESLTKVSDKASAISRTAISGKYEAIFDRQWVAAPEFEAVYTRHFNQEEPTVFQNDSLSLAGALRSRLEHTWLSAPAALLADIDYSRVIQDYSQTHSLLFYSQTLNLTLGERARPISGSASTTLLANYRIYTHEDDNQSTTGPGVTLSQNFAFVPRQALTVILNWEAAKAKDPTYDKSIYRIATFYGAGDLFWETDLALGLDLTFTDYANQRDTRGFEKTLAPSLSLKRPITRSFFAGANYAYTRNFSLDEENYAYSKHVFGVSVGAHF